MLLFVKLLRSKSTDATFSNETIHKYITEGIEVEVRVGDAVKRAASEHY